MGVTGLGLAVATRWSRAVGWSLAVLVVAYGVALAGREHIDPVAPFYGTALLLVGEAAFTVLEAAPRSPLRLTAAWSGRAAALAGIGVVAGGVVTAIAAAPIPHGDLVQVLGVGVAAALLAGVTVLVRRRA